MDPHTYRYRSTVFGEGCDIAVTEVDGLSGYESRSGDMELPRGHGSVPGPQYVAAHQIMFKLAVAGTISDVETLMSQVRDTFAVTGESDELVWGREGMSDLMVRCRPTATTRTETPEGVTFATPAVALIAHDPRIYSAEEQSALVPIYTPSGGGLNYPVVNYPKNWAAGVTAEAVVSNDGTADAYPLVRFYGPISGTVTGVVLSNLTTGEDLDISATILAGQVLTFDGTAYVTANGEQVVSLDGSTRYGDWEQPRVPFRLAPGENVLRFTLTGSSTNARCLVTWRSTWLY